MPCKTCKKNKNGETRRKTSDFKSKFACILEASESTRLRMEELSWGPCCRKRRQFITAFKFGTQIYSYASSNEDTRGKSSSGQGMGNIWENFGVGPDKVRSKSEVIDEARTKGAKVHFASLMDIGHLRDAELETKHQKNSWVVLRGEKVKDDSGSYAVFTEQGSSASQLTAAKSWKTNPDCQGAQDKQQTQNLQKTRTKRRCSQITENSWIGMSRHFGFVYHDTNGQNHGPVWKTQSFLLNEICMVILWQDCHGKGNLRKSYWNMAGRKFQIGNVSLFIKIGWKEAQPWSDVEITQQRSRLGRTNIYPWSCILRLHSKTIWNKQRYCGQLQSHVRITNFRGENWKTSILREFSYFFVVLRYGRSCKEMCGNILWVGEQDDSGTLQSINSMHWRPSFQRRRIELRGRNVKSMLPNCSEMLVLGTNWKTSYSMVSEQICTIDHKMDQSLWQTIISFDFLHSSYMWLQTILSCGRHFHTMQIGIVWTLRYCRRSWGFKIYIRWNIVHFWKSCILFP